VPDELRGLPDAFRRTIRYPFLGSYFGHEQMTFCYVLPLGVARGYVYRVSGGGDILNQQMLEYILYEVMEYAEAAYAEIVKPMQEKVRAVEKAKQDAARAVEVFAARFKQAVEADAKRVVAALQAGKQAQLRDWLNDMKPPEALYDQLRRVVLATARDVENQREAEERKRQEAVREAERKVAEEREFARQRLLSGPIPFAGVVAGSIVLGTRVKTGDPYKVDLRKLRHLLLCGVSGAGKSVLLHLIMHQMVELPEFEKIVAIDLKGGVEFVRYRNNQKVEVVWNFDNGDVARAVEGLMRLAEERQTYMRENGLQNWPALGRVALVIDEFAEVQSAIDTAAEREEKVMARRLAKNLVSLARRARALGIHIVIAAQKHTTDAIDSALLNNLNWRLVLRQGATHTARALLDIGDGFDELPEWPTELPTGRFYAYDTSTGGLKLLQAHVAPGVELG
jgi:hypothetical protein